MSGPRILIVLMGALGDVVRGMAIVAEIKRGLPAAHIAWLVEPKWESVVRSHPQIDEVLVFQRARPLAGVLELRSLLRARKFDICLDLQRHFKSGFFAWLSSAPRRIGFNRRDSKEFNWLFQTETLAPWSDSDSKLEQYLHFVRRLGFEPRQTLDFGFSAINLEGQRPELACFATKSYAMLILGASWASKAWPAQGYEELLQILSTRFAAPVLLVGDTKELSLAEELATRFPFCHNLIGKTSLVELIALLKNASFAVGPDSGPAHLAAAVGTSHVTLFGPTDPRKVAPWRLEHLVVQSAIACRGCYRRRCPGLNSTCMRLISPQVIADLALAARPSSAPGK